MPNNIRTIQGQAWDQLARASYGSEKLMHHLLSSNTDNADVLLFSGNTPLEVPDVGADETRRAAVQPAPWERMTGGR